MINLCVILLLCHIFGNGEGRLRVTYSYRDVASPCSRPSMWYFELIISQSAGQVVLYQFESVDLHTTQFESVTVGNGRILELRCVIPGALLEWSFFNRAENDQRPFTRLFSTHSGASELQTNFTNFTFSRISETYRLPLMARLLIGPTHTHLNGSMVMCRDIATSNTSSTLVYVKSEDSITG